MKSKIKYILTIIAILSLSACGTTTTTTTSKYDTDGNITETITVESNTSDLAAYINSGEGNVTSLNGDITKFNIGYGDIGLSWFSISGGRQKAPANDESNSAEALEKIAEVVKATKTSIVTESLSVNTDLPESEAIAESESITESGGGESM